MVARTVTTINKDMDTIKIIIISKLFQQFYKDIHLMFPH